jgi:hypothetical protein
VPFLSIFGTAVPYRAVLGELAAPGGPTVHYIEHTVHIIPNYAYLFNKNLYKNLTTEKINHE